MEFNYPLVESPLVPKKYRIELVDRDLFQLLDGLEIRAEAWEKTAEYLRTEQTPEGEFFLIEECSDVGEATQIGEHYREIIRTIRQQVEDQR